MSTFTGTARVRAISRITPTGQGACGPSKWALLQVVEDIREPLGLKSTSISVLRAMISFIKGDQITGTREDGHICFASNAALAKRTHVSVQTVERHITKLVSLGLLRRRPSGNGKRWARRDTSGRVVLATGLSLMPLVEKNAEFTNLNAAYQEKLAQLAILRDRCALALARLKPDLTHRPDLDALFRKARNLIRRRPSEAVLTELLREIDQEMKPEKTVQPTNLRDTDIETEGHKEPILNQSHIKTQDDLRPNDIERAYPKLCKELRTSSTQSDCQRRMDDLASYLGLGNLWFDIKQLGPTKALMVLGYVFERTGTIQKPHAYARHIMRGLMNGAVAWQTLLIPATGEKGAWPIV